MCPGPAGYLERGGRPCTFRLAEDVSLSSHSLSLSLSLSLDRMTHISVASYSFFSSIKKLSISRSFQSQEAFRHATRFSPNWKTSQWKATSPVTGQFNCCRECSPNGTHATWAEVLAAFEVLRAQRAAVTKIFHSKASFNNFIEAWMSKVSADDRKQLSYYGGITRHTPSVKESIWLAETGFFDPGNWTYMKGMQLISPELLQSHGWNQETVRLVIYGRLF